MSSPSLPSLRSPRYGAFALSLIVAWALLALLALGLRRGPIEGDLAHRASAAAARASGAGGVRVSYEGRDATLHGTFPDPAALARARAAVARVDGTRTVDVGGDVRVAAADRAPAGNRATAVGRPPRPVSIAVGPSGLTISATAPDAASRRALLEAATGASDGRLVGDVTVSPGVGAPPAGTLGAVARALGGRSGSYQVTLTAPSAGGPWTADLAGTAPSAAERGAVYAAVAAAAPGVTFRQHTAVTGTAAELGRVRAAIAGGAVRFASGDADLTGADRARLAAVAAALRGAAVGVIVAGNADATGGPALNEALSARRARACADFLRTLGVPTGQMREVSYGADRPVATNTTPAGRAANRRADLTAFATS